MRLSSSDGYRPMPFLMLLGFLLLIFSPRWTLAGGLAGSGQHSLAISAEQSFGYAWGANQTGQIGFAPTATAETSRRYPFLWSPGGQVWTQVASGDWHSVALQADGTVWTWGLNTKGQLGDGTTVDHAQPRPLSELSRVSAVAAGSHHSLAVTEDGRVWAWGENDYRQLGNNSVDTARTPGPVQVWVEGTAARPGHAEDLTGVVAVAASPVHSVALKSDGTVWAWGDNRYGQLGLGNTLSKATAHPVIGLPPVRAITAGGTTQEVLQDNGEVQLLTTAYTLALTADGAVWGWGYNGHCQLGDSEGLVTLTPRALPNLSRLGALRALVSGGGHGVALTADGQVWTWGDNSAGQLGDATPGRRCEPAPVLANGATISAGVAHTLVTTADGAVWAWGKNHQGQLGDGRVDDRQTPEPVKGVCGVGQLNVQTPPPAGCPLTLTQTGDGSGTVTGAGDYAAGAMITLTATPDADSRFDGWKPESCAASFPMPTPARALTCTAMFTRIETVTYLLTLNTTGTGGGVVNGGGNYPAGAPVALTAEPALGSAFIGWSPPPCAATFAMPAAPLTCMATFEPLPIVPLTVLKTGNGTVSGGGQYQVGETVTLTATPQNEAQFASWSPAPCASVFTMPAEPLTCTATFTTGSDPHVVTLVQHYYQAILGRAADPDGQAYWEGEAARMQDLGIDLPEVFRVMAGQFFTSAEYRSKNPSDPQYVTDLYHTFFQREPDVEGLTHWTTQLAAGLPRDIVLYEFLFSAEFTAYMQSQFGDSASRAEALAIVDFYRGLLGRLPDNEGFRYWLDQFGRH